MSKELLIITMFKSMNKSKCVEILLISSYHFSFEIIFVIIYLLTDSMPSDILFLFLLLRETQYLHTIVVKRIRFGQVYYIESIFLPFFKIMNSVEKPLGMTICINIILQNQIIFEFCDFHSS